MLNQHRGVGVPPVQPSVHGVNQHQVQRVVGVPRVGMGGPVPPPVGVEGVGVGSVGVVDSVPVPPRAHVSPVGSASDPTVHGRPMEPPPRRAAKIIPEKRLEVMMKEVHDFVPPPVVNNMLAYLNEHKPELQGAKQQADFLCKVVYVCLYKDLFAIGFDRLLKESKPWLNISKDSLMNNQSRVRSVLGRWGRSKCPIGNAVGWKSIAESPNAKPVFDAHLTIKSCDYRRAGKRRASRRDRTWSHRLDAPGIRIQCLMDMHTRFRWLSDPYSPRVADEDFLIIKREWFEFRFKGTVIAGGPEYARGRKFEGVTFLTPDVQDDKSNKMQVEASPMEADVLGHAIPGLHDDPSDAQKPGDTAQLQALLDDSARDPLAITTGVWRSLQCFWEDDAQHESLIWLAAGVHNCKVDLELSMMLHNTTAATS